MNCFIVSCMSLFYEVGTPFPPTNQPQPETKHYPCHFGPRKAWVGLGVGLGQARWLSPTRYGAGEQATSYPKATRRW